MRERNVQHVIAGSDANSQRIAGSTVAPGPVWTPLNATSKSAEAVPSFGQDTLYDRPAQPEEIAPTYVFLASNADSTYITGEVIALLGGKTIAG
jgi:NAD(P)-dependent dehydrogenase (short-subunit alcohol dehydrogenase family)